MLIEGRGIALDEQPEAVASLNDIPAVGAYLRRIGAQAVNWRKARRFFEANGYLRQVGSAEFSADGSVRVSGEFEPPNITEAEAIKQAFVGLSFPCSKPFLWTGKHLPQNDDRVPWSKADPRNLTICWHQSESQILFVQERVDLPNGQKLYRPWSYWSDGRWHCMEPDGKLPLFGLPQLNQHSIACIHEGGKAAQAVLAMLNDPVALSQHPWGEDLKYMAHLGWLGGAERPHYTDWAALRAAGVKRLILICDNDRVGKNVVRPISRALQLPMDALFFDERFKVGFDLADPFPDTLFDGGENAA
jgi:hypothetical protein